MHDRRSQPKAMALHQAEHLRIHPQVSHNGQGFKYENKMTISGKALQCEIYEQ